MLVPKKLIRHLIKCSLSVRTYSSALKSAKLSEVCVDSLKGNDSGIIVLGLNRPKARNALGKTIVSELTDLLENLKHLDDARVVILRSLVPGVFCAGADLKERLEMKEDEVLPFVNRLRFIVKSTESLPMPVIAALDGLAVGGGFEMALGCDIIVASNTCKMGLVETKVGILPGAGGTQKLPRLVGPAFAKELIFTARTISGVEAYERGIVNYVVEQNEHNDAAYQKSLAVARSILPNAPVGIRMAKKAINKSMDVDINTGYTIEEACYAQVISTKDRIEGLAAFREKRPPKFTGS
ncbi:methylglutaconyl-CoA hydratase, mitochondrial [Schistocerca gregaria]|uniref:methylglutaconyl-CoA hydratase, mitochondrial n=1 Tax=Schistocerca gregaria TaxID=7010 RepID=UPI00211DEEF9|nr:methylglutaconyl-CoA hydratase, mitochondrial [Schistocerca gregaria]